MAFTISAEAFPVVNREIGMGIAVSLEAPVGSGSANTIQVFWNFHRRWLALYLRPNPLKEIGPLGSFHTVRASLASAILSHGANNLYRFLNLIAELACFLFVIDTQGFGLEHINQQCELSSWLRRHDKADMSQSMHPLWNCSPMHAQSSNVPAHPYMSGLRNIDKKSSAKGNGVELSQSKLHLMQDFLFQMSLGRGILMHDT
jgi:hypothetical protein